MKFFGWSLPEGFFVKKICTHYQMIIIIYPDHMILRCNKPKGILIQMVFTSRMFVKDVCTYYRMIIIHPDHMVLV